MVTYYTVYTGKLVFNSECFSKFHTPLQRNGNIESNIELNLKISLN